MVDGFAYSAFGAQSSSLPLDDWSAVVGIWRHLKKISINHAAFLLAGIDPTKGDGLLGLPRYLPPGFTGWCALLIEGLIEGRISGDIVYEGSPSRLSVLSPEYRIAPVDRSRSLVQMDALKRYLEREKIPNRLFSPELDCVAVVSEKDMPDYPPKLAAAVACWKHLISHPELIRGTTVKKAATAWLKDNAKALGLVLSGGSPNLKGIDEVAKVVNWQPEGGAPKTPG